MWEQWHLRERHKISVQALLTSTGFALRPMCAPAALLWRCRIPYNYVDITAIQLRSYQNAERCWLFWACLPSLGVLCDPTASTNHFIALLRLCLRSFCALLGVLHFSWTPWDRNSCLTVCHQSRSAAITRRRHLLF